MIKKYLYSSLAILAVACATIEVPTKVLSEPEWSNIDSDSDIKRVVVTSTNFFSGAISPQTENFNQAGVMSVGGSETIEKYINILKDRYVDQVLLVDSGEINEPNSSQNFTKDVLAHYKRVGYDAIQFSEQEYLEIDDKFIDDSKVNFVNTNIINLKKQGPYSSKHISPYIIKNINGVRVAILAISTYKNTDAIKEKRLNGLYFEDPVLSILKAKRQLRRKKINAYILLVHTQSNCIKDMCSSASDIIESMIKRLPPNSIDAIIGSSAEMISRKIHGIPVIQNEGKGKYLSRLELFYSKSQKKIISDKTIIHSPTKLCSRFFMATMDCHINKDQYALEKMELIKSSDFEKIPARFLGKEI
ncbi:hypothetical protein [Halobacteriovorax sp. HLS]|uniref:hypothetical protein n=1 Tax=Halobacteriovorax sp. HLS TaxID=2234000 RepID=UPI000FD95AC3|nr:hypothetical protein [Halobacteriovorax sp. HLS]